MLDVLDDPESSGEYSTEATPYYPKRELEHFPLF